MLSLQVRNNLLQVGSGSGSKSGTNPQPSAKICVGPPCSASPPTSRYEQTVVFLACRPAPGISARSRFAKRSCTGGTGSFANLDLVETTKTRRRREIHGLLAAARRGGTRACTGPPTTGTPCHALRAGVSRTRRRRRRRGSRYRLEYARQCGVHWQCL